MNSSCYQAEMYPLAVIISHDVLVFDYEDRPDVYWEWCTFKIFAFSCKYNFIQTVLLAN